MSPTSSETKAQFRVPPSSGEEMETWAREVWEGDDSRMDMDMEGSNGLAAAQLKMSTGNVWWRVAAVLVGPPSPHS